MLPLLPLSFQNVCTSHGLLIPDESHRQAENKVAETFYQLCLCSLKRSLFIH